jgi:hypothetical protein
MSHTFTTIYFAFKFTQDFRNIGSPPVVTPCQQSSLLRMIRGGNRVIIDQTLKKDYYGTEIRTNRIHSVA